MNNKAFKNLLIDARQRPINEWQGNSCFDIFYVSNRLSFSCDKYEVQINEIIRSVANIPQTAESRITSLILDNGYEWSLKQDGAKSSVDMFATPGSVIRLNPNDVYSMPIQKHSPLVISVIESKPSNSTINKPLDPSEMIRLWNLFTQKFDDLLLTTPNFLIDAWDNFTNSIRKPASIRTSSLLEEVQ